MSYSTVLSCNVLQQPLGQDCGSERDGHLGEAEDEVALSREDLDVGPLSLLKPVGDPAGAAEVPPIHRGHHVGVALDEGEAAAVETRR